MTDRPRITPLLTTGAAARVCPQPGAWRPTPSVVDRSRWALVPAATRQAVLARAEGLCTGAWRLPTASETLRFVVDGDRVASERPAEAMRERLGAATLAAVLTDDDRWHHEALDGIWAHAEMTTWCYAAHDRFALDEQTSLSDPDEPFLDLFAAEVGALLSWCDHLVGDRLPGRARDRLRTEVDRRVLAPFLARSDWHWYGATGPVNNWNPWIHSNVLTCALLLETDRDRLRHIVVRVAEGLDHYLAGMPLDGGCDEGADYWWLGPGRLYSCLEQLAEATGGRLDATSLIARAAGYLPNLQLADSWYVNVADGSARQDRVQPGLLERFGVAVGDRDAVEHARAMRRRMPASALSTMPLGEAARELLVSSVTPEESGSIEGRDPLPQHVWLPDTGLLVAREHGGDDRSANRGRGLTLAVKAGHNGEGHNHNDVGEVVVAVDGRPAIIDVGAPTYTAASFGPHRYDVWCVSSSHHNVPEVDGVGQSAGPEHRATGVRCRHEPHSSLTLDLAAAFHQDAAVSSWIRTATLRRGERPEVVVDDEWTLERDPARVALTFMAAGTVEIEAASAVVSGVEPKPTGRRVGVRLTAHAEGAHVECETIDIDDERLRRVWGSRLHRLRVVIPRAPQHGRCRVTISEELL